MLGCLINIYKFNHLNHRMKYILPALLIALLLNFTASAQEYQPAPVRRSIRFNFITKDSVNLALNEDFEIIEDSCAQITRYAHLNMQRRMFFGPFTDVSRLNPKLVITSGNYNNNGLKDGAFTMNFLNGQLQAKGGFKNGRYDGDWQIFYDDGKPRLKFKATDDIITITDAWDEKGKKYIDNGKGNYRIDNGIIYWKGKLLDGRPNGTWEAIKTDDATETDLSTESYRNGVFQKGKSPSGVYTDAPRMQLIPTDMLPFTHAERLRISMVPCDGTKRKHLVNAQYGNGFSSFSDEIGRVVRPYIEKVDIRDFENEIDIEGYVNDLGILTALSSRGSLRDDIARGLISRLHDLPSLVPAKADGKPVRQKIIFKFVFEKGMFSFSYRLLAIESK
jgi:hypothetical protein